jgi:hypothetical protein
MIPLLLLLLLAAMAALMLRGRRRGVRGYPWVYVEDDGSVRELVAGEREYLETPFYGGDGNRPYVKWFYSTRTPDGRLRGFLRRSRVPRRTAIAPAPPTEPEFRG